MNELELKLEALSQRIGALASRYEVELASMRAEATISYTRLQKELMAKNDEVEELSKKLDEAMEGRINTQAALDNLAGRYDYCVSLLNENGIEFTEPGTASANFRS